MACEPCDLCKLDSTPWTVLELSGNCYNICEQCADIFHNVKHIIIQGEGEFKKEEIVLPIGHGSSSNDPPKE